MFYVFCLLATLRTSPEHGRIEGKINFVNDMVSRQGVVVLLNMGDSVIEETYADTEGKFQFDSIFAGVYSLTVKQIGYRNVSVDSVHVMADYPAQVTVYFPHAVPCPYDYSYVAKPGCVKGHRDNIIPIVYGMPDKRHLKKARKRKIHLAGCNVSDCDPKFYCLIHKVEF